MSQELRELASFMPTLEQLMQDDSVRRLVNHLPPDIGKLHSLCHTHTHTHICSIFFVFVLVTVFVQVLVSVSIFVSVSVIVPVSVIIFVPVIAPVLVFVFFLSVHRYSPAHLW